jgi:hypothetical protein
MRRDCTGSWLALSPPPTLPAPPPPPPAAVATLVVGSVLRNSTCSVDNKSVHGQTVQQAQTEQRVENNRKDVGRCACCLKRCTRVPSNAWLPKFPRRFKYCCAQRAFSFDANFGVRMQSLDSRRLSKAATPKICCRTWSAQAAGSGQGPTIAIVTEGCYHCRRGTSEHRAALFDKQAV